MTRTTLTSTVKILSSKKFILISGLSLLLSILTFAYLSTQVSNQFGYKNKVYPGKTTIADLEKIMGKPEKTSIIDNRTVFQYPSGNQYLPNFVEGKGGKVSLVQEQVLNSGQVNLRDFVTEYGQPESKVFSEKYGILAPGHVWEEKGIIIFANEIKGDVIEAWYFEPQSTNQFLSNHPELSKTEHQKF